MEMSLQTQDPSTPSFIPPDIDKRAVIHAARSYYEKRIEFFETKILEATHRRRRKLPEKHPWKNHLRKEQKRYLYWLEKALLSQKYVLAKRQSSQNSKLIPSSPYPAYRPNQYVGD